MNAPSHHQNWVLMSVRKRRWPDRKLLLAATISTLMAAPTSAAPLTCDDVVRQFAEQRAEMGKDFSGAFGPDIFETWNGDGDAFDYSPAPSVTASISCAADGLFRRFDSVVEWVGEPDPNDWMTGQFAADMVAIAVQGELGPDLAKMFETALDDYTANKMRGFGEASMPVNSVYSAAVKIGFVEAKGQLTYSIVRLGE